MSCPPFLSVSTCRPAASCRALRHSARRDPVWLPVRGRSATLVGPCPRAGPGRGCDGGVSLVGASVHREPEPRAGGRCLPPVPHGSSPRARLRLSRLPPLPPPHSSPQDLRQVQGRQPPGRRGPWDFVAGALRPPSLLLPRAPCSSAASSPTRDGRSCDRRRQRRRSQSVSGGSLSIANGWPRGREASVQPPLTPGPLVSPSDRWIITEISA